MIPEENPESNQTVFHRKRDAGSSDWMQSIPFEFYSQNFDIFPQFEEIMRAVTDPQQLQTAGMKLIDIMAIRLVLLSDDQVDFFVDLVSKYKSAVTREDARNAELAMYLLYRYAKPLPKDQKLNFPDDLVFILKDLICLPLPMKILSIMIQRNHEVLCKLVQVMGGVDKLKREIIQNLVADRKDICYAATILIDAIWSTSYFSDKWHVIFTKLLETTPQMAKQKRAFSALCKYVNSANRAEEILDTCRNDLFSNLCQSPNALNKALELIQSCSYFTHMSLSFLDHFSIEIIFKWLFKANKNSEAIKRSLIILSNMIIDKEEDAPYVVNWILNTRVYEAIAQLHENAVYPIWEECISFIALMVQYSTFAMCNFMMKQPIISYMLDYLANSGRPDDDPIIQNISFALRTIVIFVEIQNGNNERIGFLHSDPGDETNQMIAKNFHNTPLYKMEDQVIVLSETLRDEVLDCIERDENNHECLTLFLQQLDEILGTE